MFHGNHRRACPVSCHVLLAFDNHDPVGSGWVGGLELPSTVDVDGVVLIRKSNRLSIGAAEPT